MGIRAKILLFSECFKLSGFAGVVACCKYLSGHLVLDEIAVISSEISREACDA